MLLKALSGAHSLWSAARDLLYPEVCAGCDRVGEGTFCPTCSLAVTPVAEPFCRSCGLPGSAGICPSCRHSRPGFALARSAGLYVEPLARAIRQLKYHGREHAAQALAPLLAGAMSRYPELLPADLLVPVPIHARRLRWRGYNQSALLVEGLAALTGIPWREDLLDRPVHRPAQVKLSRDERARNIQGVFRLAAPDAVKGLRVLLVDDVMTTGATVGEAARALLAGGASRVAVLTLAREP